MWVSDDKKLNRQSEAIKNPVHLFKSKVPEQGCFRLKITAVCLDPSTTLFGQSWYMMLNRGAMVRTKTCSKNQSKINNLELFVPNTHLNFIIRILEV